MVKIRTLKYNREATAIIEHLGDMGFTIYRAPARFSPSGLIVWKVSTKNRSDNQVKFIGIRQEIRNYVLDHPDLITEDFLKFGYMLVLELEYMDQFFQVQARGN